MNKISKEQAIEKLTKAGIKLVDGKIFKNQVEVAQKVLASDAEAGKTDSIVVIKNKDGMYVKSAGEFGGEPKLVAELSKAKIYSPSIAKSQITKNLSKFDQGWRIVEVEIREKS